MLQINSLQISPAMHDHGTVSGGRVLLYSPDELQDAAGRFRNPEVRPAGEVVLTQAAGHRNFRVRLVVVEELR